MHRCRAFTLVELLVVIAIIAIVAAILFPVFAQARASAKTTASLSNIKQLGTAVALYVADYDDVLPLSTDGPTGTGLTGGWMYYTEFGEGVAGRFLPEEGSLYAYVRSVGVYRSEHDPDIATSRNSWAFNGCLVATEFQSGLNPSKSMSQIPSPSDRMVLGEEGVVGEGGDVSRGWRGTNDGFFNPAVDHFSAWHRGKTLIVFADTHAKLTAARAIRNELVGWTQCAEHYARFLGD